MRIIIIGQLIGLLRKELICSHLSVGLYSRWTGLTFGNCNGIECPRVLGGDHKPSTIAKNICKLWSEIRWHRTPLKGYKSAAFSLPNSCLRTAGALSRLTMLLATTTLIALCASVELVLQGQLDSIDWHGKRGLKFIQIGLRQILRSCYLRFPIPTLRSLPRFKPTPAFASALQRMAINRHIEFSKVTVF